MAFVIHPKYRESRETMKVYMLGVFDSTFRTHYRKGMKESLTAHQYRLMEKVADDATLSAIRGYTRVTKDYRKVVDNRQRSKTKSRKG